MWRPHVKHFEEKVKRVRAMARVNGSSFWVSGLLQLVVNCKEKNVIWTRRGFQWAPNPCLLQNTLLFSPLLQIFQKAEPGAAWHNTGELLYMQPTPCRFILQKPKVNTGTSRYLLKNTNKYCLAVPTTPVLTLLLDQTAGRTLPVLSEVMNPGIKCRSMDTNIPFASSGD